MIDIKKLWEKYKINNDETAREELILYYSSLVKLIVGRLFAQQYSNRYEYDDLYGYGILGLIDAIEKYKLEENIKFETYANFRIRGEIIDQMRSNNWVPRSIIKKSNEIRNAIIKLQNEIGYDYTNKQLAEELNITEDELLKDLSEVSTFSIISLEEKFDTVINFDIKSDEMLQDEILEKKELLKFLSESIERLPENEKMVISLYYSDERLTYKEIGKILNITESRVSQIHTKAISTLNAMIKDY